MHKATISEYRKVLLGNSPLLGYACPKLPSGAGLAEAVADAGILAHYVGDTTTGSRAPATLSDVAADGEVVSARWAGSLARITLVGVRARETARQTVSEVLTVPTDRDATHLMVACVRIAAHAVLMTTVAAPGTTDAQILDPVLYVSHGSPELSWTIIPTQQGVIPQSSTSDQLLVAMHALRGDTPADPAWAKDPTNQGYTISCLAGLGLAVKTGRAAGVLTPAGASLISCNRDLSQRRLARLLSSTALVRTAEEDIPDLLHKLDGKLPHGRVALAGTTLRRRLNDVRQWRSWCSQVQRSTGAARGTGFEAAVVTQPKSGDYTATVAAALLSRIARMSPRDFENLAGHVLANNFDDVTVTRRSGDGGIDVTGRLRASFGLSVEAIVQVKRWSKNVGIEEVQRTRGIGAPQCHRLLISSSDFTPEAYRDAADNPHIRVELVNGATFARECVRYQIGVTLREDGLYELTDFSEFGDLAAA